ncbi:hypothetical protein Misp06_01776 [Microbulbifer sp. NBRC 101763]|uniref:hypothetical protein n=1 Tax=Microbulbifer sp. NBRC 101763 TaxID=1113820 RepID=UPI0030A6B3FF
MKLGTLFYFAALSFVLAACGGGGSGGGRNLEAPDDSPAAGSGGVVDSANTDEVPPEVSITFPSLQDTWTYQREVILRGTASDDMQIKGVYVNDVLTETTDNFSNWKLEVNVDKPTTEFVIKVVDTGGNETILQPLRINAHDGFARRAYGALAIDSKNSQLYAGPHPTKIQLSNFAFNRFEGDLPSVTAMAIDEIRNKWYVTTLEYLAELSLDTGEVLEKYEVETEYASIDVDEVSGKVYWNNSGKIDVLDPTTGIFSSVSGVNKGKGPELESDTKVAINSQIVYAFSDTAVWGQIQSFLYMIDLETGDRNLYKNLYDTPEKITRVTAAASHPDKPILYFLASSELSGDGVENLYGFNLNNNNIFKIIDMESVDFISADFELASLQIDRVNDVAYILSQSSGQLYKVILGNGSITQVSRNFRGKGPSIAGISIPGFEYDVINNYLVTLTSSVWSDAGGKIMSIDVDSGDRKVISGPDHGLGVKFSHANDLSISQQGNIFVADSGSNDIKIVNTQTGDRAISAGNDIGCCTSLEYPSDVEVDAQGTTAVIINPWKQLLKVDLSTGNRTILTDGTEQHGTGPTWDGLSDIEVDFDKAIVYALGFPRSGVRAIYEVSLETGDRELLLSSESSLNFPNSTSMFFDSQQGSLLFPTWDESASYFEFDLEEKQMKEKQYFGNDTKYRITAFTKAGNRLFAKLSNPNSVAEIDPQTRSVVIISE